MMLILAIRGQSVWKISSPVRSGQKVLKISFSVEAPCAPSGQRGQSRPSASLIVSCVEVNIPVIFSKLSSTIVLSAAIKTDITCSSETFSRLSALR